MTRKFLIDNTNISQKATLENAIILFVCPHKFCITIVSSFSWDLQWYQEKTKTMLMKKIEGKNKETKKKKTQGFDRTAQNHDYYIAVIAPTPTHRKKGDREISLKPLSSMSWKFTIILLLPFKRPFL